MFVHLCLAVKLRQCDKHQKCTCLRCASVTAAALSTHPHVFHLCFGDAGQLSLSPPFLPRPGLSWVLIVNLKMEKQGYNLETSKVGHSSVNNSALSHSVVLGIFLEVSPITVQFPASFILQLIQIHHENTRQLN